MVILQDPDSFFLPSTHVFEYCCLTVGQVKSMEYNSALKKWADPRPDLCMSSFSSLNNHSHGVRGCDCHVQAEQKGSFHTHPRMDSSTQKTKIHSQPRSDSGNTAPRSSSSQLEATLLCFKKFSFYFYIHIESHTLFLTVKKGTGKHTGKEIAEKSDATHVKFINAFVICQIRGLKRKITAQPFNGEVTPHLSCPLPTWVINTAMISYLLEATPAPFLFKSNLYLSGGKSSQRTCSV